MESAKFSPKYYIDESVFDMDIYIYIYTHTFPSIETSPVKKCFHPSNTYSYSDKFPSMERIYIYIYIYFQRWNNLISLSKIYIYIYIYPSMEIPPVKKYFHRWNI